MFGTSKRARERAKILGEKSFVDVVVVDDDDDDE